MFAPIKDLGLKYQVAHNIMRNVDGLHPQEAFDELLKYLFLKIQSEIKGDNLNLEKMLSPEGTFQISETEQYNCLNKMLSSYLEDINWLNKLWPTRKFNLSKEALISIHNNFKDIIFTEIPVDKKSAALGTFLSSEIRRGLGIFLTPDDVVKSIIQYIDPKPDDKILDLACGSGTFLLESCNYLRNISPNASNLQVYGIDKNPRMLLLAQLNLGSGKDCIFYNELADSLFVKSETIEWYTHNSFDIIITNPPFGVVLKDDQYDFSFYSVCQNKKRQYSEIVFLEKCLKLLKPGGRLGIVLPKSVVTNSSFINERNALGMYGYIESIVFLPVETFQITGTQTTTVVLFVKKYTSVEEMNEKGHLKYVKVENVGYDTTGRKRNGNELQYLPSALNSNPNESGQLKVMNFGPLTKGTIFSKTRELLINQNDDEGGCKLEELVNYIGTGNTPGRSKYNQNDEGLFLVKVGNLTGKGIDWIPRERNFVDDKERFKRETDEHMMLQKYDIVLTSSAHSPRYIAEKVDLIENIPLNIGGAASYVGEVMLIRPNLEKIDPYYLYVYLSLPSTKAKIQNMITGQTAHLNSKDLKTLGIPSEYLTKTTRLEELKQILQKQVKLSEELNSIMFEKIKTIESIDSQ